MNKDNRLAAPILSCAAGAVLLATTFSSALAQGSAGNEARGLEEVIVTARKREESLQDTPVVISALTAKTISDFGIESVQDISDFTPGLIADGQGNPGGGILFLRGVGSGALSPSVDQAVSLVVDDMQMGNLNIQHSAMIDMESVQVYKGPQALFFGKNSPGGVLSIRTADPGDEFEAQLKTGYEFEAEEWFVQGMVSGPISDKAAGRFVVRHTETEDGIWDVESGPSPSSLDGSAIPGDSVFARGTLVLTPTDDLTIRTKLTYNESDATADGKAAIQRVHCPLGAPQLSPPYECKRNGTTQYVDLPQSLIDYLATQGIDTDPTGAWENEQLLATVSLDYDINDELRLSSVTGYYDMSNFGVASISFSTAPGAVIPIQDYEFEQFTQELRLASDFSGPVNFVTGVFYEQKEHLSATTGALNAGLLRSLGFDLWVPLGVGVNEYVQDTEAVSIFIDLTWDITDNLELSTGVRYSDEEKEFKAGTGFLSDVTVDWDDVSPQVTLSWTVNDEWMLFASYREGFKSGGFDGSYQAAPSTPVPYEPETVEGFEIGAKGSLFDNTLQLNAAIFSYDYDEMQLSSFNSETITLATLNAAEAELEGAEVDFVWITPVDGLQARGAITFLDAEFVDYVAPCVGGQSIAAGCNLNFANGAFNSQDLSGAPLNFAADLVATLGFTYEQALDSFLLGLSLDATYSDEYVTSAILVPESGQDSYTRVNAAVRLSGNDETWSVSLVGRNLTDEQTATSGSTSPFTGSGTGTAAAIPADSISYVAPGRTIGVEFAYNF